MGRRGIQIQPFDDKREGFFSVDDLGSQWSLRKGYYYPGGLVASVGRVGMGFGVQPSSSESGDNGGMKLPYAEFYDKYVQLLGKVQTVGVPEEEGVKNKKKGGLKQKIKVRNPSLRRLMSGAIAGAVSRTAVAPLEI